MKCNYKRIRDLNPSDREYLKVEMSKFVQEELNRCKPLLKDLVFNNFMKVFCVSANELYGFGAERLTKILNIMCAHNLHLNDSFDWAEIEMECKRILGKDNYSKYFKDKKITINKKDEIL